jgi:hypothetical protein
MYMAPPFEQRGPDGRRAGGARSRATREVRLGELFSPEILNTEDDPPMIRAPAPNTAQWEEQKALTASSGQM